VGPVAYSNRPADDLRVAAEPTLPDLVVEDDHGAHRSVGLPVPGTQEPTEQRLDAEEVGRVPAQPLGRQPPTLVAVGEAHPRNPRRHPVLEDAALRAEPEIVGHRVLEMEMPLGGCQVDFDDPVEVPVCKRTEDRSVDHAEDRGGGSDPERERNYR
jgi:hypothetical protein